MKRWDSSVYQYSTKAHSVSQYGIQIQGCLAVLSLHNTELLCSQSQIQTHKSQLCKVTNLPQVLENIYCSSEGFVMTHSSFDMEMSAG